MGEQRLCRWGGWGKDEDALLLDDRPKLKAYLVQTLGGFKDPPEPIVAPESIVVERSRLSEEFRTDLMRRLRAHQLSTDDRDRLVHSLGRSYRDLLAARQGNLPDVTDGVLYPQSEEQVIWTLEVAQKHRIAVVPFGGGTSVVGGVQPARGQHSAVLTLDTERLTGMQVDVESRLAHIEAGVMGPEVERQLQTRGFTLGHLPQSFEYSTFGGWVATRGAGQQSTRYGKIEDLVQAVRLATPNGWIQTKNVPASASGPSVLQHIVGSEGTLGVITSAVVRIRPLPESTRFMAFLLPSFEVGCDLLRQLEQAELPLSVVRLSDAEETRWLMQSGEESKTWTKRLGRAIVQRAMRRREYDLLKTAIALISVEGDSSLVQWATERTRRIASGTNAIYIGSSPGQSWARDRFRHPYLRDELIARGVMVDTLETATTWTNLLPLYDRVRRTISETMSQVGPLGVVLTHLSHLYPSGSSLYFTFLARQVPGGELKQWQAVKLAATRAIVEGGGTLSHHHGIGNEHLPLKDEYGETAMRALAATKASLDPAGVMNPGKLFDSDDVGRGESA